MFSADFKMAKSLKTPIKNKINIAKKETKAGDK